MHLSVFEILKRQFENPVKFQRKIQNSYTSCNVYTFLRTTNIRLTQLQNMQNFEDILEI